MDKHLLLGALVILGIVALGSCAKHQADRVELQFRIGTTKKNAAGPADCDEHFAVSIPLLVKRGAAKVTGVHNGIWIDVAWSDLRRARGRDAAGALEFEDFRYTLHCDITAGGRRWSRGQIGPEHRIIRYGYWTVTNDLMLVTGFHSGDSILYDQWRLCRQEPKTISLSLGDAQ